MCNPLRLYHVQSFKVISCAILEGFPVYLHACVRTGPAGEPGPMGIPGQDGTPG
jgi:hypothetical protein